MRVNMVLAIGVIGEEADCQEFMELCAADLDHRSKEIADDIMGGRVQVVPAREVIDEVQ